MTLSTYGHVIEELEGAERRSAEAVVRAARGGRYARLACSPWEVRTLS